MMNRREMIAFGLAGGAASVWVPELFAESGVHALARSRSAEISNRYLRARFETETGRIQAWLNSGASFLINATARAVGPDWVTTSFDSGVNRTARAEKIQDSLGNGQRIVAECVDQQRQLMLGIAISLYDDKNALVLECWCENGTAAPLRLRTLEPLRAVREEQGFCEWPYLGRALHNGFLYADPGGVEDFSTSRHYPRASMWNMGFAGGDGDPGLAVGFVENDFAVGRIEASSVIHEQRGGMSIVAEAELNQEFVVEPRGSARSGRFALQIGPDPFNALEGYAQMIGDAHSVRSRPIINGWCPWFYGHVTPTEDEILRNADFAARHLKPYGLEFIQIDDGYQRAFSDWEGNERFPHGMKWLADQIRERGLRPGIWVAPYVVSEGSEVHRDHPDWLIRNLDGSIRVCGNRGATKLYGLDISVPAAQDWFRRLFGMLGNDWGYEFIKFDFVEWTILSAERYHDPTWSRAMAYRKGAEIMREALGPDRHLLDCGPAQVAAGLIDSTRIELDLPFLTWQQYAGDFNSTAPAMAKRYYFHRRAWINDADHLGLSQLTPSQAMAAASLVALSGGTLISGDRLTELDGLRLDILQKTFPSFGEAARPVDLFERDLPEIFVLKVEKPFEEWWVVGLFNYDGEAAMEKSVPLSRLGLDADQEWLAVEFWEQRLLGSIRDELRALVPPMSVALVALRKRRDVPQVLSTSRHFTQGGVELQGVAWDAGSKTLAATSLGGVGTRHNVIVHVPPGYALALNEPEFPHDFAGYSVVAMQNGLTRVHVSFGTQTEIPWRLKFERTVE